MKVLLVDDHDEFRRDVRRLLEQEGHVVEEVNSAQGALDAVRNQTFEVILLDFSMPGHSGLWFMEQYTLPPTTRVLFATAHVSKPLFERMLASGAAGCLVKPFDAEELLHHAVFSP